MLFELINKQQKVSKNLQDKTDKKDFLLTHSHPINHVTHVVSSDRLAKYLKKVQTELAIPESKHAVPRDFKKTAITMRAEDGWTTPQLKHIANHRTFDSIDAYSAPSEEFMINEQRNILLSQNKLSDRYVSKGKIINGIDDKFEKRLLENPRAHKISNLGFCSDVSGCGNHFECLDCDDLIPDKDLEEYYLDQTDRYLNVTKKQIEMEEMTNARDSHHRASLFASLYNKVQVNKKDIHDKKR